MNARDARKLAQVFAPDANFISFNSPRLVGPHAIVSKHLTVLAGWPSTQQFSLEVTHFRFLSPALALIETVGHFSEGAERTNRGTVLMARHDGRWHLAAVRIYPAEGS